MATSIQQTSGFVDNWQGGKTLAECNLHMLNTEDSCDVTFQCGGQGHVMKAHRYVLISRSCVFHAMFTGPLAEKSDITVPEIEHRFFKQFILYLYTDNATVDSDNATALLYAARKYGITGLESKCLRFLERKLTVDNACVIFEAAHRFDQKQLMEKAMTLVKGEGKRSLKSPGFLALSHELVDHIVESDDLVADEHVIFNAVNNWAEAECGRQGREVTPEVKTSFLGDTLMKIRFPLMNQGFLANEVKVSGLLTAVERLNLFDHLSTPQSNMTPFNHKTRQTQVLKKSVQHLKPFYAVSRSRFPQIAKSPWIVNSPWNVQNIDRHKDAISFKSNKNLEICGYQLYGCFQKTATYTYHVATYTYHVESYLAKDGSVMNLPVQTSTTHSGADDRFDVLFPTFVHINAGEWYTLAVTITGSSTCHGREGASQIPCFGGVQFQFRRSNRSTNRTDVFQGQIPSLIYHVP